jgi:hypothetical protein
MRKRTALLVLGVLLALCMGYVVFSCRCFYLEPKLRFGKEIDDVAKSSIRRYFEGIGGVPSCKLDFRNLKRAFRHPMDDEFRTCEVRRMGSVEIWVVHQMGSRCRVDSFLEERRGEYRHDGSFEFCGRVSDKGIETHLKVQVRKVGTEWQCTPDLSK